jgi:hypothetical protein
VRGWRVAGWGPRRSPSQQQLYNTKLCRLHSHTTRTSVASQPSSLAPTPPAADAADRAAAAPQVAHTPSGAVVEIDDWLIEFANLFRDVSGLDSDRHIDFHNEGWDATTKAMEVGVDAKAAGELFGTAEERFKEVTCTGLLNWWVAGGALVGGRVGWMGFGGGWLVCMHYCSSLLSSNAPTANLQPPTRHCPRPRGNVSVCEARKIVDGVDADAGLDAVAAAKAEEQYAKAEVGFEAWLSCSRD